MDVYFLEGGVTTDFLGALEQVNEMSPTRIWNERTDLHGPTQYFRYILALSLNL
jgi:hypothetical protein